MFYSRFNPKKLPGLKFFNSLSLRVLVLTVAFVILSEAIILIPSIARSYQDILQQKIDAAYDINRFLYKPSKSDQNDFLDALGANSVQFAAAGRINTIKSAVSAPMPNTDVNLIDINLIELSSISMRTLWNSDSRIIRLSGMPGKNTNIIVQIILDDAPIRRQLGEYTIRNIQLSVSVAVITALLVFAALQFYMVGPLQRLSGAMTAFRLDPENPLTAFHAGNRMDEIGTAERELAHMQNKLRLALRQNARLAALGTAMTKINHDLRNMLATAQLVADRMANINDPDVQKLTPRLSTAIDRANALCESTLDYAKEGLPQIDRSHFSLANLAREVAQAQIFGEETRLVDIQIPESLQIYADRDEFFRVLTNLVRNSIQAGAKHITITSQTQPEAVLIRIADDGPGLKPTARERLFQPFAGSTRKGGTGLGLTIARDLMRAHDGDIILLETSEKGTVFQLSLPARTASATAAI